MPERRPKAAAGQAPGGPARVMQAAISVARIVRWRTRVSPPMQAAQAKGYGYLAITDHSRRVTMAHGLDPRRLLQQAEAIDRLNATLTGFVVLKSWPRSSA